ncbi:MAG: SpoIIE family protein phosphatase [Planctomycetota bacterium]|jgi:serine phosphatase RsbU (regulator of sigma subunit)/CheY-like chemotaxis protein
MRRILLIEDDRGMAHGLRYNLETEGYAVVHAADGRVGIEKARKDHFDLILLDLMLPHRSGFEVLRELRGEGDRTPIILMSARDAEDDRVEGLRLGADDFVGKPFGLGELLARIRARTRTARKVAVLDSALHAAARNEKLSDALASLVDRALGLIGAERGLVIMRRRDGSLHTRVARAEGGVALADTPRFSTTIVQKVFDSGATEAMLDSDDRAAWNGKNDDGSPGSIVDMRLRQVVCAPLRSGDRTFGVLYADSRLSALGFGREDLELVETLAAQSAALIERAKLKRAQRERRRMEAELTEAKLVQQAMLPARPVSNSKLEIAGFNRPCEEAGGDYYDYIKLGENRVALVIGDVAGHGVGSALFMAAARSLLRTFLPILGDAGAVLGEVNRALARDMPAGSFMSLFLGDLDLTNGQLRYASAGHAPGIVYRADERRFDELKPTGPALGIIDNATYEVCKVVPPLRGQDAVLLYTDGATEAVRDGSMGNGGGKNGVAKGGPGRELFGLERLKDLFAELHCVRAPQIVGRLAAAVTEYSGGRLDDDISFLVVKATAAYGANSSSSTGSSTSNSTSNSVGSSKSSRTGRYA